MNAACIKFRKVLKWLQEKPNLKKNIWIPIETHHKTVTDLLVWDIKHNGTRLGVTTWLLLLLLRVLLWVHKKYLSFCRFFRFLSPESSTVTCLGKIQNPKPSTAGSRDSSGSCGLTSDVTRYLILPWTWIWSWQTWHFIIRPTEGKHTNNVHIRICIFMCHSPIREQCAVCVSLWIHLLSLKRCGVHQDSVANS